MIFDDKQVVMLELKQPEVLGSFVKKLRNLLESVAFTVSTGTGKPVQIPERYQLRFTSSYTVSYTVPTTMVCVWGMEIRFLLCEFSIIMGFRVNFLYYTPGI